MTDEADNPMTLLTGMTKQELEQVVARAQHLLGDDNDATDSNDARVVHDLLADLLHARGTGAKMPWVACKRCKHFDKFAMGAKGLCMYIDLYIRPATKVERVRAIQVLLDLLIDHVDASPAPLGHKTVTNKLGKVGEVVNHEFPGYMEIGALRGVLLHKNLLTARR